jgi:tetratricopeptide (TPR) repeat protein
MSYFVLAFFYATTAQPAKAIPLWEEGLKIEPDHLIALESLVLDASDAHDTEKERYWANVAVPLYEKHLKLFPDDESKQTHYPELLVSAGRLEEAKAAVKKLEHVRDCVSLYNTACTWNALGEYEEGGRVLRKAIQEGFAEPQLLRLYLEDEKNGIGKLKGTTEWEDVRQIVEKIEAGELAQNHG